MKRWLVLDKDSREEHVQCVLSLLRYLSTAKAITVSDTAPKEITGKYVYLLDVNTKSTDEMLGQLCLEDVLDYRENLDEATWDEMLNTPYPDAASDKLPGTGFAIIDGEIQFTDVCMSGYSILEWMHLHCGLSTEEAEDAVYGSISEDRILFCKGVNLDAIDFNSIDKRLFRQLLKRCHDMYGVEMITVWNGTFSEQNSSREFIGTFSTVYH